MGSSFLPRLVNGPFDDPVLFVPFRYENRAFLFDLGEIYQLTSREILKVTHIFVTHTHMDHFAGFDRILRIFLGRNKDLYLYGPPGFIQNVEGKLAGYTWNLVENYTNRFRLHVSELHPRYTLSCRYSCRNGFQADGKPEKAPFDGQILREPSLTVHAALLDHGTPVLGFSLRERFHVNIDKTALDRMEIRPGPWLNQLKGMIYNKADPDTLITIPCTGNDAAPFHMPMEKLESSIVMISPGQSLAYITDVAGSEENLKKIRHLAKEVDHLFIEAAFSDAHRDVADEKNHLTARMSGEVARLCGVKQLTVFHFSPRYTECPERLTTEADIAFQGC
jgi:ribonuclease Z